MTAGKRLASALVAMVLSVAVVAGVGLLLHKLSADPNGTLVATKETETITLDGKVYPKASLTMGVYADLEQAHADGFDGNKNDWVQYGPSNHLVLPANTYVTMTIHGYVNAQAIRISFGAEFVGTTLSSGDTWWGLDLRNSEIRDAVSFTPWHVSAEEHRPFSARYISLNEAQIGGLIATGAALYNPGDWALNSEGAHITGLCELDNTTIEGTVGFNRATLDAGLSMKGSALSQPVSGWAVLAAGNITSGADVYLHNLTATGEVSMIGATINGQLGLNGVTLTNEGDDALTVFQSTISGGIFMGQGKGASGEAQPFTARGRVSLAEATLASLRADGAHFLNPGKWAIDSEGAHITGDCLITNAKIEGTVVLNRATLDAGLSMIRSTLSHAATGHAVFAASRLRSVEAIHLKPSSCIGDINLGAAHIQDVLHIGGSVEGTIELSVSKIEKNVIFSDLESFGLIRMENAVIDKNLIIR
jgi:hypothetical protein